jgi:serine protease Do
MIVRLSVVACAFVALAAFAPVAWGQNLEKVEERLKAAQDRADAAPPAELPPPATPPRLRGDDLPPPAVAPEAPQSGYLGVVLEEAGGGLAVAEVTKDSPAEKAGLKAGDKITAVNRAPVKDIEELGQKMEPVPPGGKLTLTIERDGKESTVVATLGVPPEAVAEKKSDEVELGGPLGPAAGERTPEAATAPREGASPQRASLGISVVTYSNELRMRSDVPSRSGALISMIRPDSPAARAGLPLAGVIVAYDGQKVETAEELVDLIRTSRPGQEVELTYYQGTTLKRKSVTLAAAADPSLLGPGYGGLLRDRPLMGRAERAFEGLTRPGAGASGSAAPGVPSEPAETASLVEEVTALKARVEALETRLMELEAKLTAEKPAADAGAAAPAERAPVVPRVRAPASNDAPALTPPKKPAGAKIGDE